MLLGNGPQHLVLRIKFLKQFTGANLILPCISGIIPILQMRTLRRWDGSSLAQSLIPTQASRQPDTFQWHLSLHAHVHKQHRGPLLPEVWLPFYSNIPEPLLSPVPLLEAFAHSDICGLPIRAVPGRHLSPKGTCSRYFPTKRSQHTLHLFQKRRKASINRTLSSWRLKIDVTFRSLKSEDPPSLPCTVCGTFLCCFRLETPKERATSHSRTYAWGSPLVNTF